MQKAYSVVLDSFVSPRYTIIHINTYISMYIYICIYTDLHGIEMYRIIKYLMYFLSTHMYIYFSFMYILYIFIIYIYYIYLLYIFIIYIYDEFTTEVTGADGFLA